MQKCDLNATGSMSQQPDKRLDSQLAHTSYDVFGYIGMIQTATLHYQLCSFILGKNPQLLLVQYGQVSLHYPSVQCNHTVTNILCLDYRHRTCKFRLVNMAACFGLVCKSLNLLKYCFQVSTDWKFSKECKYR